MKKSILIILIVSSTFAEGLGNLFFEGNCIGCHERTKALSAPSALQITRAYKETYPQKEVFIQKMSRWILNPEAKTALMQEAIEKYELMPTIPYEKYTLQEIASYLYENFE
jgi:cytochrome c551/c552